MEDDDVDCIHGGVECEQPCFCRCIICVNLTYDYENEVEE